MKVLEAALVAAVTATVGFAMIFFLNDCRPLGQDPTNFPIQVLFAHLCNAVKCILLSY